MPDIQSPEGFARVKELFLACLDLPQDEQQQVLYRRCGADEELKEQVWNMLRNQPSSIDALTEVVDPAACLGLAGPGAAIGESIGPYKLMEQLGEGGMGIVYVAEQKTPVRRQVALKVIKPGMDTRQVVARFEAERQALSMMDHPHIARIFDGGSTDQGRPYFVMELVRGITITDFCDAERLTIRQRLELFIQVCQAVQHAHQKGIIHRDLKPSNILVTRHDETPVPKVIDFGVAKAVNQTLTDKSIYTQFSQMIGTPLYMSPEQAELSGLDIDTRSDVYSLGVLLYELLTGKTPFDIDTLKQKGLDELRRLIREEEPPHPSQRISTLNAQAGSTISERRSVDSRRLKQLVRGELDWIVMRALEKDRNRRYQSASNLANDIQRNLDDLPLEASPPSTIYQLRKYAKRHKLVIACFTAVVVALLLGTGLSAWQAYEAKQAQKATDQQRARAEASYRQVRATIKELLLEVGAKGVAKVPQMRELEVRILREATNSYSELIRLNPDDPEIYVERGEIYFRLTDYEKAISDYSQALRLRPGNDTWHFRVAGIYFGHTKKPGDLELALEHAHKAVDISPKYHASSELLANVHIAMGKPKEAREALKALAEHGDSPTAAESLYSVAFRLHGIKDDLEALNFIDLAIKLNPKNDEYHYCRHQILVALGRREEALVAVALAIELRLPVDHPELNPTNPTHEERQEIAFYNATSGVFYNARSALLFQMQRYADALAHIKASENRYRNNPKFNLPQNITAAMVARCPDDQFRDEILSLAANSPIILYKLHLAAADWHAEQNQWEQVIQDLKSIEELQYKDMTWINRSWIKRCPDVQYRQRLAGFAVRYQHAAIVQWEQLAQANDPKALDALAGVAALFEVDSVEGFRYAKQSYEEYLAAFGVEHQKSSIARTHLARAYAARLSQAEVVTLLNPVIQRRREQDLHLSLTIFSKDLILLGTAYSNLGRHEDAQRLFTEVIAHANSPRKVNPADAITCLTQSAVSYEKTSDHNLAEGRHRQAVEKCQATYGNESPEVAEAQAQLGKCLLKRGQAAVAEPILRQSLSIREQKILQDWSRHNSASLLGESLTQQEKFMEAEPLLLNSFEGLLKLRESIPPQGQVAVTDAAERLIQYYVATKDVPKEKLWRIRLQEIKAP